MRRYEENTTLCWAATAASLVALAGLYVNPPPTQGLIVIAGLLLLSHLVRLRLPGHPLVIWPIRGLVFTLIIVFGMSQRMRGSPWALDPAYVKLFGYLCAAELAIQYWHTRPSGLPRGEVLVLSALVFMAATTTYERHFIRLLAPFYAVCVVLSVRDFRVKLPPQVAHWRIWQARRLRAGALAIAIILGAGCAMGLTRYGDRVTIWPLRFLFRSVNAQVAGVSSSPRLTSTPSLDLSPARVMRIDGPCQEGHLRCLVFDTYQAGQWTPGMSDRTFRKAGLEELSPTAQGRRIRVTHLADHNGLLYAPLNVASIIPAPEDNLEMDAERGRVLRSVAAGGKGYAYELSLLTDERHQGPLCGKITPEQRRRCLAVPAQVDPRVRELAQRIAPGPDPLEQATAVVRYLQEQHKYSLSAVAGEGDPVSNFILEKKAAHCQYFASAATILLRCAGVPARYINGFYAHESIGKNQYVVRQRDAHAWTECWIDGLGWITIDATPASGLPDRAMPPIPRWQRVWEWTQDRAVTTWRYMLENWQTLTAIGLTAAVLISLRDWYMQIFTRRRRRTPASLDYIQPRGDLAVLARRFDRLLRRHGVPCQSHRTWTEHMDSLDGSNTALDIPSARRFVQLYQRVRFGDDEDRSRIAALRQLLGRLETRQEAR